MADSADALTSDLSGCSKSSAMVKPEDEDHVAETVASVAPAFTSRLKISDYMFQQGASPGPRKSPRTLSREHESLSSPSPSQKRPSSSPSSSSMAKRMRTPAGYASPSTYAHLPELRDVLAPTLLVLFVGLNPGIQTSKSGHAYAHPSNLFWRLLHSSGCTTRRCSPEEDGDLPRLFQMGNTNIVSRPTKNGNELSKQEMDAGVGTLLSKIQQWRPESVCFVGKGIWESVWRVRHGRSITKEQFRYGWQDEKENIGGLKKNSVKMGDAGGEGTEQGWTGARVFVATSTSGLAASVSLSEKERIWRELGVWVEQRRKERCDQGSPEE